VSLDKSLKTKSSLVRARNVLKRAERIEKLKFEDRWVEGQPALGLPKVRVEKISLGKKKKKKKDEEDDA
jgi:small basic protein (TIGR04137 family)